MENREIVRMVMILNEIHLDLIKLISLTNKTSDILFAETSIDRLEEVRDTLLQNLFKN